VIIDIPIGKNTFSIIVQQGDMPRLRDLVIVRFDNINIMGDPTPDGRYTFRAKMLTLCLLSCYLVLRWMPTPPKSS
jgi:hypothetical protein